MAVTFTYDFSIDLNISRVRMLISDTDPDHPIFGDDEVNQALYLESSQFLNANARQVYSYYRAAALLLDAIAGNKARLAAVQQILDVQLDASKAAIQLRALAKEYRETETNSGGFAIAEMCPDEFSRRERIWDQLLRQSA